MAKARNNLVQGRFTLEDLYATQDELDAGNIKKVLMNQITHTTNKRTDFGIGSTDDGTDVSVENIFANKNNFASLLSGNDALAVGAYKKRKSEQQSVSKQGSGMSQSILGGSVI